jgi:hypothetical protein
MAFGACVFICSRQWMELVRIKDARLTRAPLFYNNLVQL